MMLPRMHDSPVPMNTMSGLLSDTATAPTEELVICPSVTGAQVSPPSVVFQRPPPVAPKYASRGRPLTPLTAIDRPPRSGPMLRHRYVASSDGSTPTEAAACDADPADSLRGAPPNQLAATKTMRRTVQRWTVRRMAASYRRDRVSAGVDRPRRQLNIPVDSPIAPGVTTPLFRNRFHPKTPQGPGGHMRREFFRRAVAVGIAVWVIAAAPAAAQITTGSVFGSVKDAQGGVVPGATVTLVAARGTTANTVTNTQGDFVFPNITAGTYLLRVTMN